MIKKWVVLAILIIALAGTTNASNYMYEKSSVKGTGYKNAEKIISTQNGFNGSKLVEKESGSGNVITDNTELEAEREIGSRCGGFPFEHNIWLNTTEPAWREEFSSGEGDFGPWGLPVYWDDFINRIFKWEGCTLQVSQTANPAASCGVFILK